ncbi:FecR family protein [Prevotella sp. 10(H)]|uniref:FecR family protein n=1 Tax=Prevotella sp. 10(H) TaxID=1158294 RepID=UPI0004A6D38F|nr:FecR domain-containing protein [Prevotella sp. 10(H)]
MKNELPDINQIIIRYLDGSASLNEKMIMLEWLKLSDDNRTDFVNTRDLWLSCNVAAQNELEVDIALGKLKNRIQEEQERLQKRSINKINDRIIPFKRLIQVAAVALILIATGFGLGKWQTDLKPAHTVDTQHQLITAKGSKGKFELPDGSVVWLNSETKLIYPEIFAADCRQVVLEGAAYFEVAKDAKKPFIVKTGDLSIEVLGTTFNVDNYAVGDYIQTALLSGSVKISGENIQRPVLLKPDELFSYRKSDQKTAVEKVKSGLYADWIKDKLVFDNDYLADILISMEGRYNMQILCPEKFASKTRLSFTIHQESIEEIMNAMERIIPIKYRLVDNKIYIELK